MVFSEMIGKAKDSVRGQVVRSSEELSERIIEKLEDSGASKETIQYAEMIPYIHRLYGSDVSIKNQIKQIKNRISEEDVKEDLDDLYGKFKRARQMKLDKKLDEVA